MVTTPESPVPSGPTPPEPSLALLSNADRIEVLRQRANARRSTGEIPDRFGARVDQHFNKILQHVRPVDDTDDPLIAAAALLGTPRAAAPAESDRLSKAKRKLETLGVSLDRSDRERVERERVEALEQTVLALIDRVRDLERREHRVTALTDRVDELQWKVRKLRRDARAARAPLPHEPEDLDDDSFDDDEFEASRSNTSAGADVGLDDGSDGFDDGLDITTGVIDDRADVTARRPDDASGRADDTAARADDTAGRASETGSGPAR